MKKSLNIFTSFLFIFISTLSAQEIPDSLRIDKEVDISGIEVVAERNPAYYIMEKTLAKKNQNNYEKYKSYSYVAYDKLYIPIETDSIENLIEDDANLVKMFDEMYLFFMESISQGKFMSPDLKKETVTASQISGIKDPVIDFIIAQMNINSFYSDYINVFDAKYLSPLNKESILTWKSKYYFNIEDTIYKNPVDTIFIISFRPVLSSVFSGLSGTLHINSSHWALEEIQAKIYERNDDEKKFFNIDFFQKFEFLHDTLWFPTYTKIDLILSGLSFSSNETSIYPYIRNERYMYNVEFDSDIRKRDFNNIQYSVDPNAYYKNEKYWEENRYVELDNKANTTYTVLDSLDKEINLTRKIDFMTSLIYGKYSLWKFDLLLNHIINYNQYEGFSLGLGAETNHRLSKVFKVGGYYRYGFRDKASKWGAYTQIRLHRESDWLLDLSYTNDLNEAGGKHVNNNISLLNPDYFRNYLIDRMDMVRSIKAETSLMAFKHFRFALGLRMDRKTPCYDYSFKGNETDSYYDFTIAHLGVRFAFKEKFITSKYGLTSLGTKFPIVELDYERGLSGFLNGKYNFNKIRLSIDGKVHIKDNYRFCFYIESGFVDADLPYTELFNSLGAYYKFTLFSPASFTTMRLNEFVSDKYLAVFLRFDFVKFFETGIKSFNPKPSICFNYGLGTLDKNKIGSHSEIEIKTMEKGYYEAGIIINSILDINFYNIGFGVFYRFGPYSMPKVGENFAYKLTLSFPIM
ncbi:MAG: DUF5686 family protein [Bacteroidales bacterium]|jgi:hypothetical protein|nr:DUF5686 family protein [Bacteroidales bacterium]